MKRPTPSTLLSVLFFIELNTLKAIEVTKFIRWIHWLFDCSQFQNEIEIEPTAKVFIFFTKYWKKYETVIQSRRKIYKKNDITLRIAYIRTAKNDHQFRVILPVQREVGKMCLRNAILCILFLLSNVDLTHFRLILNKKKQTHHTKT